MVVNVQAVLFADVVKVIDALAVFVVTRCIDPHNRMDAFPTTVN